MHVWAPILISVLLVAAMGFGMSKLAERKARIDDANRQARYEACLTRTTPAVCELHLVRFPSADSSANVPGITISTDGKVGIGVGF